MKMKLRKPKYQYQDINNPYRGNPNYITNYNYEEELDQVISLLFFY